MNRIGQVTASIVPSAPARLAGDSRLRLNADACVAARSLPGACDRCAASCPEKCLRVGDTGPVLSGTCTACGRCGRACPTGALTIEGFETSVPLPNGNPIWTIECWKVPAAVAGTHALRVPCLAGIGAEQVLEWAGIAQHARLEVVDRDWCGKCSAGAGENPASRLTEASADLLAECGLPDELLPRLVRSPLPASLMPAEIPQPLTQARVDRRGFFRRLGAETAAALTPAGSTSRAAMRTVGCADLPKRARLLQAARSLAAVRGRPAPASLFPSVRVSDRCDHGQGCVTLCPTGALRAYEEKGQMGVEFDADNCVACGLCARTCRQQALLLAPSSDATPQRRQLLTRFELRRCDTCTKPFAGIGEQTLCPECRRNRQMGRQLFGSLMANS